MGYLLTANVRGGRCKLIPSRLLTIMPLHPPRNSAAPSSMWVLRLHCDACWVRGKVRTGGAGKGLISSPLSKDLTADTCSTNENILLSGQRMTVITIVIIIYRGKKVYIHVIYYILCIYIFMYLYPAVLQQPNRSPKIMTNYQRRATPGATPYPCNIPHRQQPAFCRFIDARTPKFSGDAARAASITQNRPKRVLTSHSPYPSTVRSTPTSPPRYTRFYIIYYTWKPIYIYVLIFRHSAHLTSTDRFTFFPLWFGDEIIIYFCVFTTVFNSSCAVIIIL